MRRDGRIGWKRVPSDRVHRHLWRRADEHHRLILHIATIAAELDIHYETVVLHRDRLIEQGKVKLIRKIACGQGLLQITCPEGAEDELGADREPSQVTRRVLCWS